MKQPSWHWACVKSQGYLNVKYMHIFRKAPCSAQFPSKGTETDIYEQTSKAFILNEQKLSFNNTDTKCVAVTSEKL